MNRARVLAWLILSLVIQGVSQDGPEVLSNDAVVKMVKAGLPENLIVEMVRSHPGNYIITSNRLIELKQAGVPATVLQAMMNSRATGSAPSFSSASTSVSSTSRQNEFDDQEWVVRSADDNSTSERRVDAETVFALKGGAKVHAISSCALDEALLKVNAAPAQLSHALQGLMNSVDSHAPRVESQASLGLDTRALYFRLQYLPSAGSTLALRESPVEQTVTPNAFGRGATISAPYSCVYMNIAVDGTGREGVLSDLCGIPNTVSIGFASVRAADIVTATIDARGEKNDPLNRFAAGLSRTVAEASDPTIATMQEAMLAKEIDVQLPLSDGDSALVRIRPQAPSFQQFVSKCLATFPDPKSEPTSASRPLKAESAKAKAPDLRLLPHVSAPEFSGTPDDFATQLAAMVRKAASTAGLKPESYDKEVSAISETIRACAQITNDMAQSVTPVKGGVVYVDRLGPQYKNCTFGNHNISFLVKPSTWRSERNIFMMMSPLDYRDYRYGAGLKAYILFGAPELPIVRATFPIQQH